MSQKFPAYKVTCADIERIKVAASLVFGRSVSPQSRLEIIARSAGFGSYAAFKAELENGAIFLQGNQAREEAHIRKCDIDARRIPFVEGVSINEIIAGALALSEHENVREAMDLGAKEKLSRLKALRPSFGDILDFLYEHGAPWRTSIDVWRSSLSSSDLRRAYAEDAVLFVSPRNSADLGFDFELDKSLLSPEGPWMSARVCLPQAARFFETPAVNDIHPVPWDDPEWLSELVDGARIFVFDEEDARFVRTALRDAGLAGWDEVNVRPIKEWALEIECEDEGGFFTIGYYGTARNDRPSGLAAWPKDRLARYAMAWFCELVNVVHGFQYEMKRFTDRSGATKIEESDLRIEL